MSQWKRPIFVYGHDEERRELHRLCEERDKKLAPGQMPTIITDEEMAQRKRLKMSCEDYVTLTDFKRRVAMTNHNFMLNRKTLKQELEDKKFREEMEEIENESA